MHIVLSEVDLSRLASRSRVLKSISQWQPFRGLSQSQSTARLRQCQSIIYAQQLTLRAKLRPVGIVILLHFTSSVVRLCSQCATKHRLFFQFYTDDYSFGRIAR